jgi:hypothetical protein
MSTPIFIETKNQILSLFKDMQTIQFQYTPIKEILSNLYYVTFQGTIKQSPIFEGHLFCPVIENFIWIEPLLRGQPSYKAISFHLSFQKSSIEFSLEYLSKATHTHKNKFWEHLCEFILVSCTCLFSSDFHITNTS